MPPERRRLLRPSTLIVSTVTLVLGFAVAGGLLGLAEDLPDDWFGEVYLPSAAIVVLAAAPVGLLVAWGEIDLSVYGTAAIASYVYVELEIDGAVLAILPAALVGLAIGLVIGGLRWLTRAPSALLSFGAGFVGVMLTVKLVSDRSGGGEDPARIEGAGLPLTAALVVAALALVLGILREVLGWGSAARDGGPGADIIPGYIVSGLGAGVAGAVLAGRFGGPGDPGPSVGAVDAFLFVAVAGIAIGGVVRGAGPVAPVAAALGGFAASLLRDAAVLNDWEVYDTQLLIGSAIVVGLVVAHALHRLLGNLDRPRPQPILPLPTTPGSWGAPPAQPGPQPAPPPPANSTPPPQPPAPPPPPSSPPPNPTPPPS